jgi:hypothetical protein
VAGENRLDVDEDSLWSGVAVFRLAILVLGSSIWNPVVPLVAEGESTKGSSERRPGIPVL